MEGQTVQTKTILKAPVHIFVTTAMDCQTQIWPLLHATTMETAMQTEYGIAEHLNAAVSSLYSCIYCIVDLFSYYKILLYSYNMQSCKNGAI